MVRLDLEPSEYFRRNIWITTSGMFDHDALNYCLAKVGAERVLFAIDYPYEDSSVATDFLAKANLDDEQRAIISHRNAEQLFRVPPNPGHDSPRAARPIEDPPCLATLSLAQMLWVRRLGASTKAKVHRSTGYLDRVMSVTRQVRHA